jgi:hypothetical protein
MDSMVPISAVHAALVNQQRSASDHGIAIPAALLMNPSMLRSVPAVAS